MSRLSLPCGNGCLFPDLELGRGADGTMTGCCFPELLVDGVRLAGEGRADDVHDLFDALRRLARPAGQAALVAGQQRAAVPFPAERMPLPTRTA
ncbi:hypothetical protein AB0K12_42220 [Nonomuraea sp. NPDC049419]|uniref:hypothetical protein n=1 Tax=Nonomuraea sp. NPDC049419 TaxID=3155772 RepID=UPI00344A0B0C